MHHGYDAECLDKDYGGILIVWDRLFGTYRDETHRPHYGLTKPVDTYNIWRLQTHEYAAIARDVRGARRWRDKLAEGPPAHTPSARIPALPVSPIIDGVHITARTDTAVRALIELASGAPTKAEALAAALNVGPKILEAVLADLRNGELVCSRRGPDGGYWLARPAAEISIADVIRVMEGPLASVRGERPEDVHYDGVAAPLQRVWIAVRVSMRSVLEAVSIADVAADDLPALIGALTADPQAWRRRE